MRPNEIRRPDVGQALSLKKYDRRDPLSGETTPYPLSHEFLPAKRGHRTLAHLPSSQMKMIFGEFIMTMRATNLRLALSASAIALFALPSAASAATCVWNGGAGSWSPSGGWSACAVPTSTDDVSIVAGGSAVNVTGISAFAATLALGSGNALNLSNSNFYIYNGAVTNNGTINVANGSQFLSGAGAVTFGGTGVVALDNSLNFANLNGNGQKFTFGSGQTVRGAGSFGVNNTYMSVAGLVSADVSGGNLSIDAAGGSGGVGGAGFGTGGNAGLFNSGTMEAKNGGTLSFESGLYENGATGVIQALNGSTVSLNGDARIVGGTLTTVGTGVIKAFSASQYLNNVTLSAGSKIDQNNDNLYLNGSFTNNGTLKISNGSQLFNEQGAGGALTISGSGTIVLDNSANFAFINGNGGKIIFGSNQSVVGSGSVGVNNTYIQNNNIFSANSGSTISIDAAGGSGGVGAAGVGTGGSAGLFNANIIEATGNSTVSFESGLYENALGGVIRAVNNSFVNLNGDSRIVNGTLTSDATSSIKAFNASQYLNNVTLSAGSKIDQNNDNLYLNGSFINNGTLKISNGSRLFNEQGSGGALTISGTGTIVLDNTANFAYINGNGGKIIFGSNQAITGSGNVGINNSYIVNNNVFSASGGGAISIDAAGGSGGASGAGVGAGNNSGLLNNNIIEAVGASTVSFESGLYENVPAGIIRALGGSTILLNGDSRIVGGTLTSDATSSIKALNQSQYLNNVTLSAGSTLIQNNDNLYLNTSFVNNGTLKISNGSQLFNEQGAGGALTISGSGVIQLDNTANFAYINGNGGKIIFGSNQAITGSGSVGVNNSYIVNNNVFSASGGGAISIDAAGGSGGTGGAGVGTGSNSGLLNNNIIEAVGASTVSFESGLYENAFGSVIRALGGSTILLNGDSRIVGGTLTSDATSSIRALNQTQYLNNVTLSAGSKIDQNNDNLYLNGSLTNNGMLKISNGSQLFNEQGAGGALTIGGTGTIVLDNTANFAYINGNGGQDIFGTGVTIRGAGNVGVNNTIITNFGLITSDAGSNLSIDATGGSGGLSGGGVGTGNNSGLLNTGTIQAANGSTLSFESGRYENSATGTLGAVGAGSTVLMNSDANLLNIQSGNLNLGNYISSTTGAASTLNIRGTGGDSISTIGTGAAGTNTTVTLSGANSVFNVTGFSSGVNTSIDSTLFNVAGSGQLNLLKGRNMTIVANSGNFTNSGLVQMGGSAFSAASFNNSGTLRASSGINSVSAVTGSTGTIETLSGATLNLGGASSAGFLKNNGTLGLGTNNITVTSDYTNAAFGSGNAFAAHNNVTGAGLINATSATMDLSGPNLSGGILNVGNVRTGGSSSTTLTITNNGNDTTLRGAVQNTLAPSVALTGADWVIGPNGGNTTVTISYTGAVAGSLSGQTLNVVNNFDNVANQTIGLAGNIYQVAQAGSLPASITLGARRVGDAAATAGFSIANVAPVTPGFNEDLKAVGSVGSGFTLNGSGTVTVAALGAGGTSPVTLSHSTGTAGAFSSTVSIANTSLAVAGSGLSDLALAGQSITVAENVYAAAVASLSATTVNFGVVRKNAASPTGSVGVTNSATGALTDTLVTSTSGMPVGVTATAPGALTAGQSGNVNFSLNTSAAGVVLGSGSLDFKSTNGEMADLALASKSVAFSGTVTELASGAIFKNAGLGVLAGGGNSFTLDLGSLAANSGAFTTDLGVTNLVVPSAFAELLGGSFTQGAGTGYSFTGNSFSGLVGGTSNLGNLLSFDTTGLANGTYTKQVTFNGFSRYTGLNDFSLTPINVNITAKVTGNIGGAVPEPATWMMMLFGFGLIGSSVRRNRVAVARQLV